MSARTPDRTRPPAPRRPRVSRQRYLARRLVALALVVFVVTGAAKVVGALTSSNDTAADVVGGADVDVGSDAGTGSGDAASGEPGSTTADGDVTAAPGATAVGRDASLALTADATAEPTSTAGEPVPPSAAAPAKVLIAGDSDAGTFGPYLVTLLEETGVVSSTLDYKVSSGLSRPDFFDWPAHFRQQIATLDPDIVVVTFGGNDAQGLSTIAGDFILGQPSGTLAEGQTGLSDPEWRAEYGRRVGEVMDFLAADRRTLLWVGIPNDDQDTFTARLAVQNDVVKAEAAKRPSVRFVDTWSRFSGRDGNWAEYVIDPRDGQGKDVRADDGFHLNENGAEILALDIAEVIRQELRARGATF